MDIYSPVAAVGAIAGGIAALKVFFTLWSVIEKRITGDPLDVTRDIQIAGLKDSRVHVHFRSGAVLEHVILTGYCSTHHEAPYDFKQLLILIRENGAQYYARISEIEFFEEVTPSKGL